MTNPPVQPGQPGMPGQPGQPGQPPQPGVPGQPVQPGMAGQPLAPGQPAQAGLPGQPVQPGMPGQSVQPGQPVPGQPVQPGMPGQWQAPPPGYPPQPYPQAPYPGRPTGPSGGTTLTASILLTLSCLTLILPVIWSFRDFRFGPGPAISAGASLVAGLLIIVATIMFWIRMPVARLLAIIGLSVSLAFTVLANLMPDLRLLLAAGALPALEMALNIAALVLVAVPSTATFLTTRRTTPGMPVPPAYPPQQQW